MSNLTPELFQNIEAGIFHTEEGALTIDSLISMNNIGAQANLEIAVQSRINKDGSRTQLYSKGEEQIIDGKIYAQMIEPFPFTTQERSNLARFPITFHYHFFQENVGNVAYILPSDLDFDSTIDFMYRAQLSNGLNITSNDGITLCVDFHLKRGYVAIPRPEEDLKSRYTQMSLWVDEQGKHFMSNLLAANHGFNIPINEDGFSIMNRVDIVNLDLRDRQDIREYKMLFLPWKKFTELESFFVSLDNLMYGNGLALLLDHLRIPNPRNYEDLSSVALYTNSPRGVAVSGIED